MVEITSKENKYIKNCVKLVNSKKYRRQTGLFVAEGLRLCQGALKSGKKAVQVFATAEAGQKEQVQEIMAQGEEVFLISNSIAEKISDTQTPQGVFCVFKMLDNHSLLDTIKGNRFVLLSSLQDPGNIGTIIRTSEAFAIDAIIMSADCPDIYAPKVLRATMGGVFRIPIITVESMAQTIMQLQENKVAVYAAALSPKSVPITQVPFQGKTAVVIGNEGNGLAPEIINCCTNSVVIPMAGNAESLNAATAASIAIWEMSKNQM